MNENMTVILAKEGQPDALRKIYQQYGGRIYRLAFSHTGSKPDAEDIMQETFIKAFRGMHSFQFNVSSFSSWLNTICLNCTIDHFRSQRRKHRNAHIPLYELSRELHSPNPSPEDTAQREQAAERIRQALAILPAKQRLIFEMRYHQHMDIKDIAESLQCSQSNVKTHIFRALRKLRKIIGPIWGKS